MVNSPAVLRLAGALTVDRAASYKTEIAELVKSTESVTLDFSNATVLDLSFVQLLYAASREAHRLGKDICFSGTLSADIGTMLEIGGFCRKATQNAADLPAALFDFSPPVGRDRD